MLTTQELYEKNLSELEDLRKSCRIEALKNLSNECARLLPLIPKTEENILLRFCLYQLESAAYIHADLLECMDDPLLHTHVKNNLEWQEMVLEKLIELRKINWTIPFRSC